MLLNSQLLYCCLSQETTNILKAHQYLNCLLFCDAKQGLAHSWNSVENEEATVKFQWPLSLTLLSTFPVCIPRSICGIWWCKRAGKHFPIDPHRGMTNLGKALQPQDCCNSITGELDRNTNLNQSPLPHRPAESDSVW